MNREQKNDCYNQIIDELSKLRDWVSNNHTEPYNQKDRWCLASIEITSKIQDRIDDIICKKEMYKVYDNPSYNHKHEYRFAYLINSKRIENPPSIYDVAAQNNQEPIKALFVCDCGAAKVVELNLRKSKE